ncbi:MAG: type II toxin-antitoxin system RelE/ParE family toxin [Clostridiales bacterium]|nr:type II toxin-antitoxin system RelE/ParE family toxin [Clostridiales bacterium]
MQRVYKINYLPLAEEDLHSIIDYVLMDDPEYAIKLLEKFDESIDRLSEFPYLGTIPRDNYLAQMNYRILIVESYLVFYVFINDTIEIRRIISGKRRYDYLF